VPNSLAIIGASFEEERRGKAIGTWAGFGVSMMLGPVLGVGLSAQASAVTTVALKSVDARRSGLASAINNAFSQTAGLLAIAVLGVLMFAVFSGSLDGRLRALDLPPEARKQLEEEKIQLGTAEVPQGLDAASTGAVERAIDEAFVSGYRVIMIVVAGMALASAFGAALLIEGKMNEGTTRPSTEVRQPKPAIRRTTLAIYKTSRAFPTGYIRRPSSGKVLGAQVGEDGQNPPVVGVGLDEPELAEDVLDVLLDRALGDVERSGDGVVGATLGHEGEDLAFAGCEPGEPLVAAAPGEKLAYRFGIEHGATRSDLANRRDKVPDIGDAVLEQVTDACSP
jgi:hypothetical protein